MSKYIVCQTNFNCAETLKEALGDIGVPPGDISSATVSVEGKEQENITVSTGAGPVSFIKQEDGSYTVGMSPGTRYSETGKKMMAKDRGGNGELVQNYAKRRVMKTLAKNYGHKLKTCESKNGKIQIRISVH